MSESANQISLPARLYLLGYNLEKEKMSDKAEAKKLVRAGTLAQLVLEGHVTDSNGDAVATGTGPADPLLAETFREISAAGAKPWKHWFNNGDDENYDAVQSHLDEAGVIDARTKRILGLIPHDDITIKNRPLVESVYASTRDALFGGAPVTQVDPYAAAAAALIATSELNDVVGKKEAKANSARLDALKAPIAGVDAGLDRAITHIKRKRTAIAISGSH